ncbi:hypothetical protein G9A89_015375 [Geosiphon pyriformis]|nr:hypothetical protein G9A89_015375 [Geosiphon pyriformis]
METITINQWGKINNTQIENVKNRVEQTILEKEDIALVKDPEIRVGHSIKISLPGETPAIMLRKKLTKLWFQKATDKTITTEFLSIIQRTQPKLSDKHTFRLPSSTTVLSTKLQYLSLLVTSENVPPNNLETNQQETLTSNILPAIIMKDKLLDTIFPFKLEELSTTPLFSGATLEKKPITAIYTDAKVDGQFIKLILNSGSASSIITRQLMDQLGCQVD